MLRRTIWECISPILGCLGQGPKRIKGKDHGGLGEQVWANREKGIKGASCMQTGCWSAACPAAPAPHQRCLPHLLPEHCFQIFSWERELFCACGWGLSAWGQQLDRPKGVRTAPVPVHHRCQPPAGPAGQQDMRRPWARAGHGRDHWLCTLATGRARRSKPAAGETPLCTCVCVKEKSGDGVNSFWTD